MRRIFLILIALVVSAPTLAACGLLNTDEIKVIPKTESASALEQNSASSQNNDVQNSDLEARGQVLQADTEEYVRSVIKDRAAAVLTALRDYDMEKLSELVHPEEGVRFTPYAYVDVDKNLVFSQNEIKDMSLDSTKYVWGSYDGKGDPIELTFSDYYKKFIFDEDYMNAEETNISNAKLPVRGNTLDNCFEVYKNSIIVEYYFSGFDPQYEGMDWKSLRLVFEKMDDTWYLVGIIHGQWTI